MPYRRLPKSDVCRLRALKTILDCSELYTVGNRFIDWSVMNHARSVYDKLFTAVEQYRVCRSAQSRNSKKIAPLHNKAMLYVSHFIQVLRMAVERGEIKRSCLTLYGLSEDCTAVPLMKRISELVDYGHRIVEGEKERLKKGGRPIYNPSAGMVGTHVDIFAETYGQQKVLQERTARAIDILRGLRPEVDDVILKLWNQIEEHYSGEPADVRLAKCRSLGLIYYYRPGEKKTDAPQG